MERKGTWKKKNPWEIMQGSEFLRDFASSWSLINTKWASQRDSLSISWSQENHHVNSLSTAQCFLHTSWQCKCQQPSSRRPCLYKQPPAQLVSLLDFPTSSWRAAWLLFHAQFCSSLSVRSGMRFPSLLYCTAASSTWFLLFPPANLAHSMTFSLAVWAGFPVQPPSVFS